MSSEASWERLEQLLLRERELLIQGSAEELDGLLFEKFHLIRALQSASGPNLQEKDSEGLRRCHRLNRQLLDLFQTRPENKTYSRPA